jgi:hypothetical protein
MKILTRRAFAAFGGALLASPTLRAEQAFDHDLTAVPAGAVPYRVTATPVDHRGRQALKVQLAPDVRAGKPGIDYGDTPSFVEIPMAFRNGTIEVDVLGHLQADAPPDMRAFIGLAYRIQPDRKRFEAAYLRPLNGLKTHPTAPRDKRAVQYFAYPDWRFNNLREAYPDGRYEAGADIAGDEWITLRLEIAETKAIVRVNGAEVLTVREPRVVPTSGGIGLWVDIGTEGYFSNLRVTPD